MQKLSNNYLQKKKNFFPKNKFIETKLFDLFNIIKISLLKFIYL